MLLSVIAHLDLGVLLALAGLAGSFLIALVGVVHGLKTGRLES